MSKLIKQLYESAEAHANNIAIWVQNRSYTYQELFETSSTFAHTFQTVSAEISRVAILSQRNIFAYQSILASVLSGHTFMPLNPQAPLETTLKMLRQGEPQILCIDMQEIEKAVSIVKFLSPLTVCVVNQQLLTRLEEAVPQHHYINMQTLLPKKPQDNCITEDANLYLLFTSGSTGEPKGIAIKHHQLDAYLHSARALFAPDPADRFAQFCELTFDLAMHDIFVCWITGAALYIVPESYLLGIKKFIQTHCITYWLSVPSTITLLLQLKQLNPACFPSLKKSFFCGEVLLNSQAEQWKAAAPHSEIINMYGPTEATIAFTYFSWNPFDHYDALSVPVGIPFSRQYACLVNVNGEKVQEGAGELFLAGSQVIDSYWKSGEENKKTFQRFSWDHTHQLWYGTGDMAKWDKQYGYIFIGRKDDQWKIHGCRVEKLEIEYELRKIAGHDGVAVVPIKTSEEQISGVIAYVSAPTDVVQLMKLARERLPDRMVPKKIILLDSLPKNANGKIDYRAMKEI